MKVLKSSRQFKNYESSSIVTIGVFDGVHRGHKKIIESCVKRSRSMNLPSVALTFDKNPRVVFSSAPPCIIAPHRKKLELIEKLGIDYTIVISFDEKFASLDAIKFCENVLSDELGARCICVGENFRFGRGGVGDVELLGREGKRLGFEVEVHKLLKFEGGVISSTLIRELIASGNVSSVLKALGRPYSISGRVVEGQHRGKELGFPTANIQTESQYCIPADGVYAGFTIFRGNRFRSAINIGTNPTFGDKMKAIEIYIFDFNQDVYGETLEVEFYKRLRDEIKFPCPEELITQMRNDVERTKKLLK